MAAAVDLCNAAFVKIGEKRITSSGFATPTNERERVASENYERIRDAELRRNIWNFAITRAELSPDEDGETIDWAYAYTIPADCLRVIDVWETSDYEVAGGKILTDTGDAINIRYVKRVTVVNDMDVLFREALSARLAIEFCDRITARRSKKPDAVAEYTGVMLTAAQVDAIENPPQELPEDDWVAIRA
jgi:hypothetical protein